MKTKVILFAAFAVAFTALAGEEDAAQFLVVDVAGGAQAERWTVECRGAETDAAAFNASAFKTDKIVLRRVRAGAYWLGGADERTRNRLSTEKWQGTRFRHLVELSRDYFIGLFPVTQRQYAQVTGRRPSHFRGDELPVESVSFLDVMGPDGFMALLAKKTGLKEFGLPSLAQWEVAARAGTDTFYYWGDEADEDKALEYAWFGAAAKDGPRAVGSLKPNAWGIYDILGNVLELIDDSGYEPHAGVWRDPGMKVGASGWRTDGRTCQLRGGAWSQSLRRCAASPVFNGLSLKRASYDVGFRIVKLTGAPRAAIAADRLPEDPVAVARAKAEKVRKDRTPKVQAKFDVPRTMFISHRGESHDAPENTMAAYDMARARGLSFELDVYLSKDGKLFCFHDPDLKKVSGKSLRCEEASWEEDVKDLDVGVHKGPEWKGLKPCLLEDVFRKHLGEVPMILVHVKGDTNSVPALVRLVKACPKATPETLAWTGNDVAVAAALERELPGHRFFLGANTSRSWQPNDLDTPVSEVIARMRGSVAKVVALRWNPDVVTKRYVKALHDAGYKVDVWTPDSPADAAAAIRAGVDYITSNRAKALCDALISAEPYDVVVAGGGPAGIGAAYMAAKRGAKVLLLEKSGRLGGMAVQAMVSPFSKYTDSPMVGRIMAAMRVGRTVDFAGADVRAYELLRSVGAEVLLHATVTGPTMDGLRVTGVEAFCAEGRRTIQSRVVIDATGDGVVAAAAGVPFEMGRKGDGLVQPMSIMFTVGGIEKGRRVWCGSETEARQWKIGSRTWEEIVRDEIAAGNLPPEVGVIRLYDGPNEDENVVNATQVNRLFGVRSADLTRAEIACRKQAFQVVEVLKRHVPGYHSAHVSGMPAVVGVRETRRFEGVERLETEDCLEGRRRTNAIARACSFVVDIHNPSGAGQADQHESFATGEARQVKPYDIPYGAIVPKKVEGLLFCGRCLSASHEALASCRVMGCAMATGIGAGAAAAESVKRGIPLRNVKVETLRLFDAE